MTQSDKEIEADIERAIGMLPVLNTEVPPPPPTDDGIPPILRDVLLSNGPWGSGFAVATMQQYREEPEPVSREDMERKADTGDLEVAHDSDTDTWIAHHEQAVRDELERPRWWRRMWRR